MASMPQTKTEQEIKSLTVSKVREEYNKLATVYEKIIEGDLVYCHKCNDHLSSTTFYTDNNYSSGYFPICKKCLLAMVEQRNKKTDTPNETKKSVQRVLCMMDLPYIDSFYENCIKGAEDGMKERNRKSPFSTYITAMKSLPNWKGMTWNDSEFEEESENQDDIKVVQKTLKAAKKRFGKGYSDDQYMQLEDEYQSWCSRVEVNTKSQEEVVENLSILKLLKRQALLDGKPTDKLDKQTQDWLDAGNLKPKQNSGNGYADTLTFGQLIEKWENEDPIPEPDPELSDIDNIGKMVRIWFSKHLRRVLGLDGGYDKEYDEYIAQYTVDKPEYNGLADEDKENNVYSSLFGTDE